MMGHRINRALPRSAGSRGWEHREISTLTRAPELSGRRGWAYLAVPWEGSHEAAG